VGQKRPWNNGKLVQRPGDKALPSIKEMLLRRYYRTCNCCKKERLRLKEGEQPVLNDDADPPPILGSTEESGVNGNSALGSGTVTEDAPPLDLGSGGVNVNGNLALGSGSSSDGALCMSPMELLLSAVVEMV
jgi:hypothetical protein